MRYAGQEFRKLVGYVEYIARATGSVRRLLHLAY
jgi:hypothetical protein